MGGVCLRAAASSGRCASCSWHAATPVIHIHGKAQPSKCVTAAAQRGPRAHTPGLAGFIPPDNASIGLPGLSMSAGGPPAFAGGEVGGGVGGWGGDRVELVTGSVTPGPSHRGCYVGAVTSGLTQRYIYKSC